ncbi:hypothetical protein PCASD_00780 [Puccinia coronata f. sp. avenae]|uniref:HIT-type domain-containing protein n=1 Tax=Puccinia coronata f. sp. avenae TaxID=200324 RepID=A0A2N5VLF8_9BASI|nr:hypothetical protein PCASD_00780 [Puccinia coronata f. sp. avenae]
MNRSIGTYKKSRRTHIHQANQDTIKCFVCEDKFARYTCPNCNLRYCSVNCFGSQSHSSCSESFYKNALLQDMQLNGSSQPSSRNQPQSKMLEILKKLEADDEEQFLDDDDDDDIQDGSLELNEEDLNRLSKEQLLALLRQDQIEEFNRKLSNGQLDPEFIEQTINSQCNDPWWIELEKDPSSCSKPDLPDPSLLPALPDQLNPSLFYHIFSVTLGYVSLLRYYGMRNLSDVTEEDKTDLLEQLPQFFPILFSSDVRLESVTECFSLFLKNLPKMGSESIGFLIKDLRYLYPEHQSNPSPKSLIVELSPDGKPIPQMSLCPFALSDLYHFLHTSDQGTTTNRVKSSRKLILKKLAFFIAFSSDSKRLERFGREVENDPLVESHLDSDDNNINHHLNPLLTKLSLGNLSSNTPHLNLVDRKSPKIYETSGSPPNIYETPGTGTD